MDHGGGIRAVAQVRDGGGEDRLTERPRRGALDCHRQGAAGAVGAALAVPLFDGVDHPLRRVRRVVQAQADIRAVGPLPHRPAVGVGAAGVLLRHHGGTPVAAHPGAGVLARLGAHAESIVAAHRPLRRQRRPEVHVAAELGVGGKPGQAVSHTRCGAEGRVGTRVPLAAAVRHTCHHHVKVVYCPPCTFSL